MNKQKGLTLIELMVVVAIIAIIASIAYPSFLEQMRKTRRSDAHAHLLDIAARQERFYTEFGRYTATIGNLGVAASSPEGFYTAALAVANAGQTFSATANAQAAQTGDKCGNLSTTQAGTKGDSGGYGPDICW